MVHLKLTANLMSKQQAKVIEDTVGGVNVKIERDEAGIVTFTNLETNERIPHERDFWFAWFAFHTETKLYTPQE